MCPCESPWELSVPGRELSQSTHIFPNLDRRFSCLSLANARDNLCKNDMTFLSLSNYRADSLNYFLVLGPWYLYGNPSLNCFNGVNVLVSS